MRPGWSRLHESAMARLLCASKPAGLRLGATKNPLTLFVYIQIENTVKKTSPSASKDADTSPNRGGEAAAYNRNPLGSPFMHRRYSAKRKRRQRGAGIRRMRSGWSRLPKAVARLLSRGVGWQGDKSFGFGGLPIGQTADVTILRIGTRHRSQTERSFSFLFVSTTTWRLV